MILLILFVTKINYLRLGSVIFGKVERFVYCMVILERFLKGLEIRFSIFTNWDDST